MGNFNGKPCPFCGEGVMNRENRDTEYRYKGHTILIQQPGIYCSCCEEAILEPDDLKFNRVDIQAFKARIDGILEPKKIRSIRRALGLNQKDAGELFGGGHNAFSRYETGELAPPKALSILLDLLDSHKEIRKDILKLKTS